MSKGTKSKVPPMRHPAIERIPNFTPDALLVVCAMNENLAYTAEKAMTIAEIQRATGLSLDDVETACGEFACSQFAIVPKYGMGNSPVSSERHRIKGYYLATRVPQLQHAVAELRHRAESLLGQALEIEATAIAADRCTMPWKVRERVAASEAEFLQQRGKQHAV